MNRETNAFRVGCVLLAAGNAHRFGGNKLLADFRGKPLIEWAMDAVPPSLFSDAVLVTQFDAVEARALRRGLRVVRNAAPELGISHSVALGTQALKESCDAILFLVADQPMLRQETVSRLVETWMEAAARALPLGERRQPIPAEERADAPTDGESPDAPEATLPGLPPQMPIAVLHAGTRRGNPCLFPADLFPDLEALTGDRGGSQVLRRFPERILPVEASAEELFDVDTAAELAALQQN